MVAQLKFKTIKSLSKRGVILKANKVDRVAMSHNLNCLVTSETNNRPCSINILIGPNTTFLRRTIATFAQKQEVALTLPIQNQAVLKFNKVLRKHKERIQTNCLLLGSSNNIRFLLKTKKLRRKILKEYK